MSKHGSVARELRIDVLEQQKARFVTIIRELLGEHSCMQTFEATGFRERRKLAWSGGDKSSNVQRECRRDSLEEHSRIGSKALDVRYHADKHLFEWYLHMPSHKV